MVLTARLTIERRPLLAGQEEKERKTEEQQLQPQPQQQQQQQQQPCEGGAVVDGEG